MKMFDLAYRLRVLFLGVAFLGCVRLVSNVIDSVRDAQFRYAFCDAVSWNDAWNRFNAQMAELRPLLDLIESSASAQELYSFRQGVTFEDAHAASCRVRVNGARGSGIFFGVDGDSACILTNYHVVTNNQIAAFDFWKDGRLQTVTGTISWKAYNANEPYDFAIGKVKVSDLKVIDPPWIPLAGSDAAPSVGAMIVSSGAPDGRFTQAWKGQVLEYYSGKTAIFSPPPVPGQSGSAICEYVEDQLFVTGVLTWLIGEKGRDDSKGGAIPIANLYKALRERGVNVDFVDPNASPIPPNATECAETTAKAPCVLEFTQANCAPCKEAEQDVAQLRAFGVNVYVYDAASKIGAEYAERYGVTSTPSFVLLDEKFNPTQTFVGAGKVDAILDAHGDILARVRSSAPAATAPTVSTPAVYKQDSPETPGAAPENTISSDVPTPFSGAASSSSDVSPAPVLNLPALAPTPKEDFRTRAPVFEPAYNVVGIFDESDERWQNLKRKRDKRNGEGEGNADGEGGADNGNADNDSCKRPRLGERLADGATEAITQRIEQFADGKIQGVKDDLRAKWDAIKYKLLMGLCFVAFVGVLFAEGVVALGKWAWRSCADKARIVCDALAAAKGKHD